MYVHSETPTSSSTSVTVPPRAATPDTPQPPVCDSVVDLVPYFYGEVPGDDTVGKEKNFCSLQCHKCQVCCFSIALLSIQLAGEILILQSSIKITDFY